MRGANLTPAHQQQAAQARTHLPDFADHNKRIGADSAARQRVLLRARKGSRLLIASDVHQLWLSDIKGSLGVALTDGQRRVIMARYQWNYIFEGLSIAPAKPEAPEMFAQVHLATTYVGQGLALPHPFLILGIGPEDFRKKSGALLSRDRQKKRFRAALRQARQFAEVLQAIDVYFAQVSRRATTQPRVLGRRVAMKPFQAPQFIGYRSPSTPTRTCEYSYGRSDLPPYDRRNIRPQRPYGLPATNDRYHSFWLAFAPTNDEEQVRTPGTDQQQETSMQQKNTHGTSCFDDDVHTGHVDGAVQIALNSLSIPDLAHRCAAEARKFLSKQTSDDRFAVELFRRAIVNRDEYAWVCIYQQFMPLALTWVTQHQSATAIIAQESGMPLVNAAFAKFAQALTPAKMEHFDQLSALLKYLKMCVQSVVADEVRSRQSRQYEEALELIEHEPAADDPADAVVSTISAQGLWQVIQEELNGEDERVLLYLAYIQGLKPCEISSLHQRLFPTVDDVYRVKRNVLERLRRNRKLLRYLRQAA